MRIACQGGREWFLKEIKKFVEWCLLSYLTVVHQPQWRNTGLDIMVYVGGGGEGEGENKKCSIVL